MSQTAPTPPLPLRANAPGRPKDLEKRAAILDAAKALFPARGYDGVSMDAIAQAAGVSKLTVYSHFQDKDTLFVVRLYAPLGLFCGKRRMLSLCIRVEM